MENRSHALIAGVFLVLFVSLCCAALWWFGGKRADQREIVVVSKHAVNGLGNQAVVRYRGVRVGKVRDIQFDPEHPEQILVHIAVAGNTPVTEKTSARLAFQGLAGQAHLQLEDLPGAQPLPQGEGVLRIAMQPSLVAQAIDQGKEILHQTAETVRRLNALLGPENRERIGNTLANVERLSERSAKASEKLPETLARLQKLASEENINRLSATLDNSAKATGQIAPTLQEVRQLSGSLRGLVERLDGVIAKTDVQGLAAVPGKVNAISDDLAGSLHTLDRLLRQLEETPNSVVFGRHEGAPGPGEPGFAAAKGSR